MAKPIHDTIEISYKLHSSYAINSSSPRLRGRDPVLLLETGFPIASRSNRLTG